MGTSATRVDEFQYLGHANLLGSIGWGGWENTTLSELTLGYLYSKVNF